jgi:hypothetical protein
LLPTALFLEIEIATMKFSGRIGAEAAERSNVVVLSTKIVTMSALVAFLPFVPFCSLLFTHLQSH